MRFTTVTVALVLVLGGVARIAHAQGTYAATVSPGAPNYYSFTPLTSGPFTASLSWDNAASKLLLLLVCGTSDPVTFGVAAGDVDRSAHLEVGLIGLNTCIVGVSTSNLIAGYRLHLQSSSAQLATPRAVTSGSDNAVDASLITYAEGVQATVQRHRR